METEFRCRRAIAAKQEIKKSILHESAVNLFISILKNCFKYYIFNDNLYVENVPMFYRSEGVYEGSRVTALMNC